MHHAIASGKPNAVVLERGSDYEQSKRLGNLFALSELPELLYHSIRELERTAHYRENGRVSFYLDTVGMSEHGMRKFRSHGTSLSTMFPRIPGDEYLQLPFSSTARFFGGSAPVRVEICAGPTYSRVAVMASGAHGAIAPIVVLKHSGPAPGALKGIAREA